MKLYCPEDGGHVVKVGPNPTAGEQICPIHRRQIFRQRSSSLRSKRRTVSPAEQRASRAFNHAVCAKPCFFLQDDQHGEPRRPGHECSYPLDPHHLIPESWMRQELSLPEDELIELLFKPVLGIPLCRKAHDLVEYSPSEYIYRDELDPDLIAFCERFDAQHPDQRSLLERLYIECPEREVAGG